MKGHNSAGMNRKSVQAQPLLGHFSKSDVRYWQRAVFRQSYTRNGHSFLTKAWTMKVAYEGRRETFPLGTPNKAVAAARRKPTSSTPTCSPSLRAKVMIGIRPSF